MVMMGAGEGTVESLVRVMDVKGALPTLNPSRNCMYPSSYTSSSDPSESSERSKELTDSVCSLRGLQIPLEPFCWYITVPRERVDVLRVLP